MGARLILEFDDIDREGLTYLAGRVSLAAEDIIGETAWWRVEEVENESQA